MKIGLVGKPSAGKSTFFKAATLMDVDIANYPFTTIDPNTGFGHVRIDCVDEEFDTQCNPRTGFCQDHQRFVPFELIDVAGLVPGAHKGRGRGLAFLSDLNEADALIQVVDASGSTDAEGSDVETGSYDPCQDIRFLQEELDYWYLGILRKGWERLSRKIMQEKLDPQQVLFEQMSGLRVSEDDVKDAFKQLELPEKVSSWSDEHLLSLCQFLRSRSKPFVVAANKVDRKGGADNVARMKEEFPDLIIIPCSAEVELALREAAKHELITYLPGDGSFTVTQEEKMNEKQKQAMQFMQKFLDSHGSTGVQQAINAAVFDLLGYKAIFPGGTKKLEDSEGRRLPDCFLMPPDTTALDFAGFLHSDFAKHFIRAVNVRTKLPVGKDHVLEHRDVIEIVSGK